jgi:hypothetical protein
MRATHDRRRARRSFVGGRRQAIQLNRTDKRDRHDRQAESQALPSPALDPRGRGYGNAIAALPASLQLGELVLALAAGQVTLLFEQRAEVEGTVGLAPLACTGVALLRRTHLAP